MDDGVGEKIDYQGVAGLPEALSDLRLAVAELHESREFAPIEGPGTGVYLGDQENDRLSVLDMDDNTLTVYANERDDDPLNLYDTDFPSDEEVTEAYYDDEIVEEGVPDGEAVVKRHLEISSNNEIVVAYLSAPMVFEQESGSFDQALAKRVGRAAIVSFVKYLAQEVRDA